jgi:hypothetical protein
MSKRKYQITVGEVGNEVGHVTRSSHVSDEAAVRKARRMVRPYRGDGWWYVTADNGRWVANGGRRTL